MFTQDDGRTIAKKLKVDPVPGREHDLVIFRHEGKRIGGFGIQRSSKDKPHDYIPRQLHLTKKQCEDFIDCSLSLESYIDLLKGKGLLS